MEENLFNDVDSMVKLKYKGNLVGNVSELFSGVAKNTEVFKSLGRYGKKTRNKAVKSLYKDFSKGLKILDKRISVFVEIPKCIEQDNGQYKEERIDKPDEEKVIHVSDLPEKIEKQRQKTIEMLKE